jgi:AcrR family transcriptional regulator
VHRASSAGSVIQVVARFYSDSEAHPLRAHTAVQASDLAPRKRPAQARSQATFDAIVDACTWLLPRLGYAGATTNHIAERAGVSIASLYEYFPGKDAIVAQVAERLVDRVLRRLAKEAPRVLEAPEDDALRAWIGIVHETVARERALFAVFTVQVPYTNRLDAVKAVSSRLLEFSQEARRRAGGLVRREISPATMRLIVNLVSSTLMQLVLDPPADVTEEELLDELARRIAAWIR